MHDSFQSDIADHQKKHKSTINKALFVRFTDRDNNMNLKYFIHYLMELGPNTKKIPQNSGKQIRIPEGM